MLLTKLMSLINKKKENMKSNMKIVAFQGSYRESGITSTLLKNACSKLTAARNEVEYINLHEKKQKALKYHKFQSDVLDKKL